MQSPAGLLHTVDCTLSHFSKMSAYYRFKVALYSLNILRDVKILVVNLSHGIVCLHLYLTLPVHVQYTTEARGQNLV